MPRTHGDTFIHVSKLDAIVESDQPLIELQPPKIGPVEEAIGRHIADLVDDGACLQIGIGGIPDAVLLFLHEKNDLGIHTEMFTDGVVDLYNEGVITNAPQEPPTAARWSATFLMGTRRLYDFVDDNPVLNMFPVSYTNDPFVIAQNDNVVAINSALQVDLMGQVVADSIGPLQYTGIGGQVDFVRGAARSGAARRSSPCPPPPRAAQVSRIVAKISRGAAVTTMRADVDYVVTEYGVAHLKGKTLRERAQALLEIADPEFRDQIVEDCTALKGEACSAASRPSGAPPATKSPPHDAQTEYDHGRREGLPRPCPHLHHPGGTLAMDMKIRTFLTPGAVIIGPGCVSQLGAEAKKLGATKVLIVTDQGVCSCRHAWGAVEGALDQGRRP